MNLFESILILLILGNAVWLIIKAAGHTIKRFPFQILIIILLGAGLYFTSGTDKTADKNENPDEKNISSQDDQFFFRGLAGSGRFVRISDTTLKLISVQNDTDGNYLWTDTMTFSAPDKKTMDGFRDYMLNSFIPEIDGFNLARLARTLKRIEGADATVTSDYRKTYDYILAHFAEYSSYSDQNQDR